MKCTIPEISWHNREPVLSVDLQPICANFYRLATGGADCHVLIWQLAINENSGVKIEALSDLTRHQRAVNSVRWSPTGQYLATADDDANIIIWKLKTDVDGESNEEKETWIVHKVMRGHKEDIYDVCWSPNGNKLLSGSIDNTAILWDFAQGKTDNILRDHKGFVQGVAWDPKGTYCATISTDRICRIYECTGKVKARIQKGYLPVSTDHYLHDKDVKFFHDDTFKSFFRRLDFSPDGTLLVVPSGRVEIEDCKKILNCTYLFAVDSWNRPIALFPSGKQCSTVARFCPIMFELHDNGQEPVISLPFRMIIAVGTDNDVVLYDTQQVAPFAYFKDIHYTRLTDLTWSQDGLLLVASSTDGYCALVTFEPDELGIQYKEETEIEESIMDISGCEELDKVQESETKKPNLLEQWTIKTPKNNESTGQKRIKPIPVKDTSDENILNISGCEQLDKDHTESASKKPNFLEQWTIKTPKRATDNNAVKSSGTTKKRIKPGPLQPVVILDDIEARDAWNCQKEETKIYHTKVDEIGTVSEPFSLHLEESQDKNTSSDVIVIEDSTDKFSLQLEDSQCKELENRVTNSEVVANPDKTNIPKRRIPLITLSSPKHKNK